MLSAIPSALVAIGHRMNMTDVSEDVQYLVHAELASGSFGSTFKVSCASGDKQGIDGVLKVAHASKTDAQSMLRHEYEIMKMLEHDNIVSAYDFEMPSAYRPARLFMEYGGATLFDLVSIAEESAVTYDPLSVTKQVIDAVAHMHERSVVHRDIKLENITICEGRIKLIDFGLSSVVGGGGVHGRVGSLTYCAPEVWTCTSPYDGFKADAWSVGVVVFSLWFRFFPFNCARAGHCNIYTRYAQMAARSDRANVVRFALFLYANRFLAAPPEYMDVVLDNLLVIDAHRRASVTSMRAPA